MRKRRREAAGEGIAYGADQLPRWRPALESPRHTPRPCLHSHIVYSSRYIQFVTCPIQKCCTVHTVHTYGPNCRSVWQAAGVLGDSLWTGMGVPRHSLLAPAPSPDTVGWWGVLVASVADAALLVDAAAGRGGVLTTQTTLHREVLDFLAPPSTRGGRSPLADLSSSVLSEGRMVMDALTAAGAPSGKTIWSQGATPHPSMLPRACQPPSRPATYSPPPRRSSTRPTAMGCGSYDAAAAASTTVANLISFASCSERRGTSRMKRKNANEKL